MRPFIEFIKDPKAILIGLLKRCANLFSDKHYLQMMYYVKMGRRLDLTNPKSFTEKLQWLKLYDRKPIYPQMVDKIAVKEYVKNILGEEVIIPTLGIWDSFDEIDFEALPDKFVLKTNHSGGNSGVVVCADKSSLDKISAKKVLEHSIKTNTYSTTKEWPYSLVKPQIFAEEYLDGDPVLGLIDFKFLCFNGKVKVVYISEGKNINQVTHSFYTRDWERLPFSYESPYNPENFSKPENYDKMAECAEKLAQDTYFSRIDLYSVDNQIYFGEVTFYPTSGYGKFDPKEWDYKLGDLLVLPSEKRN